MTTRNYRRKDEDDNHHQSLGVDVVNDASVFLITAVIVVVAALALTAIHREFRKIGRRIDEQADLFHVWSEKGETPQPPPGDNHVNTRDA